MQASHQEPAMPSTSARRILLIEGHPDAQGPHLNRALADAYAEGATANGHALRRVVVGAIDFPLLMRASDWLHGEVPATLKASQEDIAWAEHVVIFFPLWLGDMPALLKGYLEQVARPGFAVGPEGAKPFGRKPLRCANWDTTPPDTAPGRAQASTFTPFQNATRPRTMSASGLGSG
jgi:putative NADPH-quinone reductase